MIRSVLAVLAGIAVLTVTSFAIEAVADPLLMRIFPHSLPDTHALSHNVPAKLFMMAYTLLCVAAGGYVTAWVARRGQVSHAVVMGVIEGAMTVWVTVKFAHSTLLWAWIAGLLVVPAAWCGGAIRASRAPRVAARSSVSTS